MFVLSAFLSLVLIGQGPAMSAQVPPGYVEIDGQKSPESIPEWLAWQNTFAFLAAAANVDESVVYAELALTSNEREAVVSAARAMRAREDSCRREQIETLERFKGLERDRVRAMIRQLEIECRLEILQAKEQLLAQLSNAAARRLLTFVEANKAGMTALVPKTDLDHFRRPR